MKGPFGWAPLILLFLWCRTAAQPADTEVIVYDEKNGLPRETINDIARDNSGIFWLGTEKGLIRFDGRNFLEIKTGIPGYDGQQVMRLKRWGDSLYVILGKGLLRMDLGKMECKVLESGAVADVTAISPKAILILLKDGTIIKHEGGDRLRRQYPQTGGGILHNTRGRVYASLPKKGVFVVDTADLSLSEKLQVEATGYREQFSSYLDTLYFISNNTLSGIYGGHNATLPKVADIPSTRISYYTRLNDGIAWAIELNKFLYRIQNGRKTTIDLGRRNIELKNIWSMDGRHALVGTNQGLLHIRVAERSISNIDDNGIEPGNGMLRIRRRIVELKDGRVFLHGNPHTYILNRNGRMDVWKDRNISVYDAVHTEKATYLATEGLGLVKHMPDGSDAFIQGEGLDTLMHIFGMYHDKAADELFVGGKDTVFRVRLSTQEVTTHPLPFNTGVIREITRDQVQGLLWLAGRDGLVSLDRGMKVRKRYYSAEGGFGGTNTGPLLLKKDTRELWAGHDRGVDIIDLKTEKLVRSLPSAIFPNPHVASMLEDDFGRIWIGTYSGIIGYDPVTGNVSRLSRNNGLMNKEYNYKAALKLSDGRLLFGGLNGYDLINPREIALGGNRIKGLITGVHRFLGKDSIFQLPPAKGGTIRFDTQKEYLRIYVSAGNTLNADKHTFEYRMGNEQWNPLSGSGYINIFRLDPGKYTLEIRGFDQHGNLTSFTPVTVEAWIPFLRSNTFPAILSIALIAILILFIAFLLRAKTQERKIKERISMDLHDEVGTSLTRALYIANYDESSDVRKRLVKYLNDSLFSLRTYINTMNHASLTYTGLGDEIRELAASFGDTEGFKYIVKVRNDKEYMLRGELYRDVKLCIFEIMNNALRHSGGDRLGIFLIAERDILTIFARDNGVLTDTDSLGNSGNGLRNIRKRVGKHHGNMELSIPRKGNGLSIRITFNL